MWRSEHVQRFWDRYSQKQATQHNYFSLQHRAAILNLLRLAGVLQGDWLDYGCGPGFLAEGLVQSGVNSVQGLEFSAKSISLANTRLQGHPKWRGAEPPEASTASPRFDGVSLIEVVEHLTDEELAVTGSTLSQSLRPGGVLFVTTPFAEELTAHTVYCPFCDSEFHHMQHVRSWDEECLASWLSSWGFTPVVCKGIMLERFDDSVMFPPLRQWETGHVLVKGKDLYLRMLDAMSPRPQFEGREFRRRLAWGGQNLIAMALRTEG